MNDFIFYVTEGFKHVLDLRINSFDHVLFFILMAAPYAIESWKKAFYASLAFTLGHTISIILSVYDVVSINAAYVEFLILATILVTAIFNIFRAGKTPSGGINWFILVITLFFGLIHGFGFASTFEMLASGVEYKIMLLLEFALGIELGQIAVIFIVLVLSFLTTRLLRLPKRDWNLVVSSIILGIILPMLAARWVF